MSYRRILRQGFLRVAGAALLCCFATLAQGQDQVAVKHGVGALHGFLVIRSEGGVYLGYGELSEYAVGDRVTVHLVYRFRNGSLDDETTEFTQGKTYQFVSDHHIQRGRFFPKPSDITVEAGGKVTLQSTDKDGKTKVDTEQMDLPADFSNGMVGTILQNVPADAAEFKLGMIVPAGKARAIKLDITRDGEGSFRIAGVTRKADVFRLKPDLGGIAGVIAPIIGKQPGDIHIWVLEGETPMIVRIVGPLAEGTASVSIELAGATFPKRAAAAK